MKDYITRIADSFSGLRPTDNLRECAGNLRRAVYGRWLMRNPVKKHSSQELRPRAKYAVVRWLSIGTLGLIFNLMALTLPAQSIQSWPEIDTYLQFNSNVRGSLFVARTRENAQGSSGEIGPNIDFFLKPLVKLKKITIFELDQSKSRPAMFRLSYRYLPAVEGPSEQRVAFEATGRYPLIRGVLLSDRNRAELRFLDGEFSWRYRNRLTAERSFAIRGYHFVPYLRAEAFYDNRFEKWNRTVLTAGSTFPVGKHFELECYYEHQNDTAKSPNRQVDGLGYVVSMYF